MNLKSQKPRIGIRPVIDGRRGGIRESLEQTTMDMAQRVAELYAGQLRYSDGTSVECVVADRCIGGVKEAAMAAEKFSVNNVCAFSNMRQMLNYDNTWFASFPTARSYVLGLTLTF